MKIGQVFWYYTEFEYKYMWTKKKEEKNIGM